MSDGKARAFWRSDCANDRIWGDRRPLTEDRRLKHDVEVDREIWFEKFLWSYMPCHWKGWAMMVVIIFPAVALILIAQSVLSGLGYNRAADLSFFVVFIPAWIALLAIAKLHN